MVLGTRSGSGFGPGFQSAESKLYRAEYGASTLLILAYLGYTWMRPGGLDLPFTVLWFLLPDMAAFIPIGLSSRRREWPAWGSYLYNVFHNALVWGAVFAVSWLIMGGPYSPLLGWLLHITLDRAAGFGLRSHDRRGA